MKLIKKKKTYAEKEAKNGKFVRVLHILVYQVELSSKFVPVNVVLGSTPMQVHLQ
jgi:hypothetical protein